MSKYLDTLETFTNIKFGELRGTWIDGKPWVVGIDVARALGYKDPANTIARKVKNKHKSKLAICQSGSNYKTMIMLIDEPAIYKLIFGSKLPEAEEFQDWVFEEVLPQIARTGTYMKGSVIESLRGDYNSLNTILDELDDARDELRRYKTMYEETKTAKEFMDIVMNSDDLITVGQLAKMIADNGYKVGRTRFYEWLRDMNYLGKSGSEYNIPKQWVVDQKLMEAQERVIYKNGIPIVKIEVRITPKGQAHIVSHYLSYVELQTERMRKAGIVKLKKDKKSKIMMGYDKDGFRRLIPKVNTVEMMYNKKKREVVIDLSHLYFGIQ